MKNIIIKTVIGNCRFSFEPKSTSNNGFNNGFVLYQMRISFMWYNYMTWRDQIEDNLEELAKINIYLKQEFTLTHIYENTVVKTSR